MLCSLAKPSLLIVPLLCCAGMMVPAWPHSMYQAAILLDFHGVAVGVELQLPVERMGTAVGVALTQQTLPRERTRVSDYLLNQIHASVPDRRRFRVEAVAPPNLATIDGAPYLVAQLLLTPPQSANTDLFDLHSDVLLDRVPSQVAFVSIRSDWRTSTFANDPRLLGVVRSSDRSLTVDRRDGSWWH